MNLRRATFVFTLTATLALLGPAQAGRYYLDSQLRLSPFYI